MNENLAQVAMKEALAENDRKWKQAMYDANQGTRELLGQIKAIMYKGGWKPPTEVADLLRQLEQRLS